MQSAAVDAEAEVRNTAEAQMGGEVADEGQQRQERATTRGLLDDGALLNDVVAAVQELASVCQAAEASHTELTNLCGQSLNLASTFHSGAYHNVDPALAHKTPMLPTTAAEDARDRTVTATSIGRKRVGSLVHVLEDHGEGDAAEQLTSAPGSPTSASELEVLSKGAAQELVSHRQGHVPRSGSAKGRRWRGDDKKRRQRKNLPIFRWPFGFKRKSELQDMKHSPTEVTGTPEEYDAAPIVEIGVTFGSDPAPKGFRKLSRTPFGRRADLNAGVHGHYIYICIKKDLSRRKPPIVALTVIFPDRDEFVPPTFSVVRRGADPRGDPVDFNAGTGGQRVCLCYKKGAGNPITDIQVIFPRRKETVPAGHILLERTPLKYEADLNAGSASTNIFLVYRQRLRNVEQLAGEALVCLDAGSGELLSRVNSFDNLSAAQGNGRSGMWSTGDFRAAAVQALGGSMIGGVDLDETRSNPSSGALNDLWVHADVRWTSHKGGRALGPLMRRTLLCPLVAALYMGNDDVTGTAVKELIRVASRHLGPGGTTVFMDDSRRVLQEFIVEALCFFINRAHSEHFDAVAHYLRAVVQGGIHGQDLSSTTLQQIYTTCVFLCNFEVCRDLENERLVGRRESFAPISAPPGTMGIATAGKDPLVFAADSTSYAALRSLIEVSLRRVEVERDKVRAAAQEVGHWSTPGPSKTADWMGDLVSEIVDDAITHVELAKATQRVVDSIRRARWSSSESLWRELLGISKALAIADRSHTTADENVFLLLVATCKLAMEEPSFDRASHGYRERDIAHKKIALDFLGLLLRKAGERFQQSSMFGCLVRRVVITCLLDNLRFGLNDLRVLRRVLSIVTCLWQKFRQHCKVEVGLVLEEVILRLLRVKQWSPQLIPLQATIISELVSLLEVPHSLVELFINYDLDARQGRLIWVRQPVAALHSLVSTLAGLAEDLGHKLAGREDDPETRALCLSILNVVAQLTRSLMDAAGHAHLIAQDEKVLAISVHQKGGGWEHDVLLPLAVRPAVLSAGPAQVSESMTGKTEAEAEVAGEDDDGMSQVEPDDAAFMIDSLSEWVADFSDVDTDALTPLPPPPPQQQPLSSRDERTAFPPVPPATTVTSARTLSHTQHGVAMSSTLGNTAKRKRASTVRLQRLQQKRQDKQLQEALDIYKAKSLKKAVQYLVASSFISDTPRDIASFVRVYRDQLDPVSVGDFLSEAGTGQDAAYWDLIRVSYVRAISFHNMTLEQALRHFLTRCGFRLPGEGQRADRLLSVFADCYFHDNKDMPCCPITKLETVHLLAYAVILLQSDLHKASTGRRRHKRMSKEQFISNLQRAEDGSDLSREYLSNIYDSILSRPIEMMPDLTVNSGDEEVTHAAVQKEEDDLVTVLTWEMEQAARDTDELLRALAVYPSLFSFVGVNANLTPDLIRIMFESIYFPLLSLVGSVLENPVRSDSEAIMACLDMAQCAISASIFLRLPEHRNNFLAKLARFKSEQERGSGSYFSPTPTPDVLTAGLTQGVIGGAGEGSVVSQRESREAWIEEIRHASPASASRAIANLHAVVRDLKDSTVQQSRNREELKAVAKRIEARANLLEGPRRFIREGDLIKRCRSGKSVRYRFFLFSDQLLYTHQGFKGEFKVHAQLLLAHTKVTNVEDRRNCTFELSHATKRFVVVAESPEMKRVWMRDITDAKKALTRRSEGEVIHRLADQSKHLMALLQKPQPLAALAADIDPLKTPAAPALRDRPNRESSTSTNNRSQPTSYSVSPVRFPPSALPQVSILRNRTISRAASSGSVVLVGEGVDGSGVGVVGSGGGVIGAGSGHLLLDAEYSDALEALERLLVDPWAAVTAVGGQAAGQGGSERRLDSRDAVALVGLFLQASEGDCDGRKQIQLKIVAGPAAMHAWKACHGMSKTAAMKAFLVRLEEAVPRWRDLLVFTTDDRA